MGELTLGGVYLKAMLTCGRLATWASRIVFEETSRQVDTFVSCWRIGTLRNNNTINPKLDYGHITLVLNIPASCHQFKPQNDYFAKTDLTW